MTGKPLESYDALKQKAAHAKAAKLEKQRKKSVKPISEDSGGHAFPSLVIEELREFCWRQRCAVEGMLPERSPYAACQYGQKTDPETGDKFPGSDACHGVSNSLGAGDYNNLWPGCRTHNRLHERGTAWFESVFPVKIAKLCEQTTTRWLKERVAKGLGPYPIPVSKVHTMREEREGDQ